MLVVNFLPHWIHLGGGGGGGDRASHPTHIHELTPHSLETCLVERFIVCGYKFCCIYSLTTQGTLHKNKINGMQSCDCHVILSSTLTLASPVKLVAVENPEVLFLADGGRSSRFIPFGLAVVYLSMVESFTSSVNNVITMLSW